MNRRHLLTAAPVAGIVAVIAGAAPVEANAETRIAALFREWRVLEAQICDSDDLSDDQLAALNERRGDIEYEIWAIEATTPIDALRKVCALTVFGVYGEGDFGLQGVWNDARRLLGA